MLLLEAFCNSLHLRKSVGGGLKVTLWIPLGNGWGCRGAVSGPREQFLKLKDAIAKVGNLYELNAEQLKKDTEIRQGHATACKRIAQQADFIETLMHMRPRGGKAARLRRTVDRAVSITHAGAIAFGRSCIFQSKMKINMSGTSVQTCDTEEGWELRANFTHADTDKYADHIF